MGRAAGRLSGTNFVWRKKEPEVKIPGPLGLWQTACLDKGPAKNKTESLGTRYEEEFSLRTDGPKGAETKYVDLCVIYQCPSESTHCTEGIRKIRGSTDRGPIHLSPKEYEAGLEAEQLYLHFLHVEQLQKPTGISCS